MGNNSNNIALDAPLVITPAVAALTSSTFVVLMYEENYGWGYDSVNSMPVFDMAQPGSVVAVVLLSSSPWITRNIVAWQGASYQTVRGIWGDMSLFLRIKGILQGTITADSPA